MVVLNIQGIIILLKAKAYREILEREGSKREIKKHINDIVRLSITLVGTYKETLDGQIKTDIVSILDVIKTFDDAQIKSVMKSYDDSLNTHEVVKILEDYFKL